MSVSRAGALAGVDPAIARLVAAEETRRANTIDLIASESEPSPPVLEALGSVFAAKTAEGYPGRRYHRGTEFADQVEQLAIDRAKALFGAGHANVQPSSGVNANLAVYRALLKPGDTVLALQLAHGGHLSHGDPASITGAVYRFEHYGVRADAETIDLDEVRAMARQHRPSLIVTGGSSYPRAIDYAAFAAIATEVEAKAARGHGARGRPGRGRRAAQSRTPRGRRDLHHLQDDARAARRGDPVDGGPCPEGRSGDLSGHPGRARLRADRRQGGLLRDRRGRAVSSGPATDPRERRCARARARRSRGPDRQRRDGQPHGPRGPPRIAA